MRALGILISICIVLISFVYVYNQYLGKATHFVRIYTGGLTVSFIILALIVLYDGYYFARRKH